MFRAENDILKLSTSSPIEMKVVDFFSILDPFFVIFGHFESKVTFLWVKDPGARGTPPPNFNMGFVCGTQGPHSYRDRFGSGRLLAGVSLGYI